MMAPNAHYKFGEQASYYHLGEKLTGVVTWSFVTGKGTICYHIRDECGNYWHRFESEVVDVN